MHRPTISILMPAYNAAQYLQSAVESVLRQTFTNFELILVNDGSADATGEIAGSYSDNRIRYVENDGNKGLVYSLNRGLHLAEGNLLARMDADDLALPGWLASQMEYLKANPEADVVACRVMLIDETGAELPPWPEDEVYLTETEIRHFMPVNNCIAHPGILAKTSILLEYGYDPSQAQAEDYDLWLRMLADNRKILKNPETLIRHRILGTSFTRTRGRNVFYKLAQTKYRFFYRQLVAGNWNRFNMQVFLHALGDSVKGMGKAVKMKWST